MKEDGKLRNDCRPRVILVAILGGLLCADGAVQARPLPVGSSTTTLSYPTGAGGEIQSFSASIDYTGAVLPDAVPLVGAPNVRSFNSVNSFGRRMFVFNTGPQFADALKPDESQIAHAFFKIDNGGDYFPEITAGGDVTIQVENVTFDQPVFLDASTVMLHVLWRDDQVSALDERYINLHNHHTATDPFRDSSLFTNSGVFTTFPVPNFVLDAAGLDVAINGNGTNQLDLTVSFPYEMLRNLEEMGQAVPDGVPAPQGFLEPFHFHLEYVVPEPATLLLLLPGTCLLLRSRHRAR